MIGVFDSGSGGLSVLKALQGTMPNADIVYFGDIAHAPYGARPAQELCELTKAGVALLRAHGATELVSACNSVSIHFLHGIAGATPIIEMSRPTAKGMRTYAGKRVLVIATPATIASGMYQHALSDIVLDPLAIPDLASAIEFAAPEDDVARMVRDAFAERTKERYDAVLLGCTHYPLALRTIASEVAEAFGAIPCIDPAVFVADEAARALDGDGTGSVRFIISKDSPSFRERVAALMGEASHSVEVI